MNQPDAQSSDPLDELEASIAKLHAAVVTETFGTALRTASDALVPWRTSLVSLERLGAIVPHVAGELAPATRFALHQYLDRIAAEGDAIAKFGTAAELTQVPTHSKLAAPVFAEVRERLAAEWRGLLTRRFERYQLLGGLLSRLEDTAVVGREMASVASQSASLAKQFPPDEAALARFGALSGDLITARQRLESLGVDDELERFLTAVADGSATLAHVTPTVLAWLRDRQGLGLFSVQL
jgi:hypothetical protein